MILSKKIPVFVFLTLAFAVMPFFAMAQEMGDGRKIEELERNFETLQKDYERVKGEYEFLKGENEKYKGLIATEYESLKSGVNQERDDYVDFLKWTIYIIGGIIVTISILAGIIGIPSFLIALKKIKKEAKETYDKAFNEALEKFHEDRTKLIIKMIKDHDQEEKIKRTKKIVIIGDEKENKNLKEYLEKLKFTQVFTKTKEDINDVELQNYDAFLINKLKPKKDEEILDQDILDKITKNLITKNTNKEKVFFYYDIYLNDEMKKDESLASANFKSQIYGNLINLLKYQSAINLKNS